MKFSLRALFILTTVVAAIAGSILALPFMLREVMLLLFTILVIAASLATGVILFTMLVCAAIDFFLERSARSLVDQDDSQAVESAPRLVQTDKSQTEAT